MTIGIYCIMHSHTGRRYIGKSVNVESRLSHHKSSLRKPVFDSKICNRHLWNDVQKDGWSAFETWVVEEFDEVNEELISERELYWIDALRTCERRWGYNIRRDSSSQMIVHPETRALISAAVAGSKNPNFGNRWTDKQKAAASITQARRHSQSDRYGEDWRRKLQAASTIAWSDPAKCAAMGAKVKQIKRVYDFLQFDLAGCLLRVWPGVEEILAANPAFKGPPIYSVCHGWKPTYRGFIWRQVRKTTSPAAHLVLALAA